MHYLKASLIASRITRPLTACRADESRGPCTSADSNSLLLFNSLHITTPVNTSFHRQGSVERGMGFHHFSYLLVLTAVSVVRDKNENYKKIVAYFAVNNRHQPTKTSQIHVSHYPGVYLLHSQLIGGGQWLNQQLIITDREQTNKGAHLLTRWATVYSPSTDSIH